MFRRVKSEGPSRSKGNLRGVDGATWARTKMAVKRETFRKKSDVEELSIKDIQGFLGTDSYLASLRRFSKDPPITDSLLLFSRGDPGFLSAVRAEARVMIRECKTRLIRLERSPKDVRVYLADLDHYINNNLKNGMIRNPQNEPIGPLRDHARVGNDMRKKFLKQAKKDKKKYSAILKRITSL